MFLKFISKSPNFPWWMPVQPISENIEIMNFTLAIIQSQIYKTNGNHFLWNQNLSAVANTASKSYRQPCNKFIFMCLINKAFIHNIANIF